MDEIKDLMLLLKLISLNMINIEHCIKVYNIMICYKYALKIITMGLEGVVRGKCRQL